MAENEQRNRTVTIDADYFAQLYRKANETDEICKECCAEHTAEEFNALVKERDELQAKLEEYEKLYSRDHERMDAAERCIYAVKENLIFDKSNPDDYFDQFRTATNTALKIIKNFIEKREVK